MTGSIDTASTDTRSIGGGLPTVERKPFYKILYVQVLIAIVLGALVGWLFPGSRPIPG